MVTAIQPPTPTDGARVEQGLYAIAEALEPLADVAVALERLATQVKYLGGGDNADQRGAVEFLAIKVDEGCSGIASALGTLGDTMERTLPVDDGEYLAGGD